MPINRTIRGIETKYFRQCKYCRKLLSIEPFVELKHELFWSFNIEKDTLSIEPFVELKLGD